LKDNQTNIPISFTVNKEFTTDDSRFIDVTIDVLHTGLNFNSSIFEKEVVDANIDSIKNTPILGYITTDSYGTDFKGHEYKTIKDENGVEYIYSGSAYGVIPESCNPRWVQKVSSDGVTRDYLQVDGLLWTKFDDSTSIFERDIIKGQSMELDKSSVVYTENEDGTVTFTSFKFDGCCILSTSNPNIEPAMIDSNIVANFTTESVANEIKEKLNEYSKLASKQDLNINDINEGGIQMAKPDETNTDFSLTVMQQFSEIEGIVSAHEQYRDRWGDLRVRYSLVDIQNDELICVDRAENYSYFGFKFTMEGDKPVIEFATKIRKKIEYTDFVEGTQEIEGAFSFAKEVEDFCVIADSKIGELTTEKETAETNYSSIKAEYEEIKPKYEDFVKEKEDSEKKAIDLKKDDCFTKFDEHLADISEYTTLKADKENLSLEQIEAKCAILFTQKSLNTNFTKKQKNDDSLVANVMDFTSEDDGIVQTKYGAIKVRK
jgi:hypothetical protein